MKSSTAILIADLILDFTAIAGFLYLLSQGYFTGIQGEDLNKFFLITGAAGLALTGVTVYLVMKRD
ncbi:hypothetical protein BMS3Abin16_01015 [archaeon BMS3Abin16]|nr:hypothetical protein BMS3Abin16_01015 [archaeon BMS3Abin16]HDY73953.1 hypothetical protein [Euryarchaeota archaeon]